MGTLNFPTNDPYVAATVHNYDPFQFTHQGADFTSTTDNLTTNVRFPGPPPMPLTPDPRVTGTDALAWLANYNNPANTGLNNPASGARIQFFADTVIEWALPAMRAVYVGEFGAFEVADPQSRVNYARTAREIIEAAGLGWAWWNWDSNFHYARRGINAAGQTFIQPNPPRLRAALLPASPLGPEVAPAIFASPASLTRVAGTAATLRVEADGSEPLSFQWWRNGQPLASATQPVLELADLREADAGSYLCVVTNAAGAAESAAAALTVIVPPQVTGQPINATVNQGTTAAFTVVASGTAPLSYQWRKGLELLTGRTGPTLELANVQPADAGTYTCVVANAAGSDESLPATLTVIVPPTAAVSPAAITVIQGGMAAFTVVATGTPPLSYQWRKGLELLTGRTGPTLELANVQPADAGTYTCVVANAAGSAESQPATLTVIVPPGITASPESQSRVVGSPVTFTVVANGTPPLSYQWQKGGEDILGATASSHTISAVAAGDAGEYRVTVSNAAGSAESFSATLTVLEPPVITAQPASVTRNEGQSQTFSVTAHGKAPLAYQWFKGMMPVLGQTTESYQIPSVSAADAGSFTVVITNVAGSITSAPAVLTVIVPPVITTQPEDHTVIQGATVSLRVAASGTGTLSYQWFMGTNALPDGTVDTLQLIDVQVVAEGTYTCVVSNEAGSAESRPSMLVVNVPPPSPCNRCRRPSARLPARASPWWPPASRSRISSGCRGRKPCPVERMRG